MADEPGKPAQPKRKRGRPKQKVTKRVPFHEGVPIEDDGDQLPYDMSLLTEEDKRKVVASYLKAQADGGEPEIVHAIMRKPPKPPEFIKIIVHKVEGESNSVGPLNAPATHGQGGPPLWIYRGEEVICPAWVEGNLEGAVVSSLQCDMTVSPPYYFEAPKTRFPYHVVQRGLSKKDYEDFKDKMGKKKHNPWQQPRTVVPG